MPAHAGSKRLVLVQIHDVAEGGDGSLEFVSFGDGGNTSASSRLYVGNLTWHSDDSSLGSTVERDDEVLVAFQGGEPASMHPDFMWLPSDML